jgi:hypothetical protein
MNISNSKMAWILKINCTERITRPNDLNSRGFENMINFIMRAEIPIPAKREIQSGDGQESAEPSGSFQKEVSALSRHDEAKAHPGLKEQSRSRKADRGSKAVGEKKEDTASDLSNQAKPSTPDPEEPSKDVVTSSPDAENEDKPGQSAENKSSEATPMNFLAAVLTAAPTIDPVKNDIASADGATQAASPPASVDPSKPGQVQDPKLQALSQTAACNQPGDDSQILAHAQPGEDSAETEKSVQAAGAGDSREGVSQGKGTVEKTPEKITGSKGAEEIFQNLKGDDQPEPFKILNREEGLKNEKGKEPVHKKGIESTLIQGLQNDEGSEKKSEDTKGTTFLKDGLISVIQGGEAKSAGSEDFNSGSGRKERDDLSWKTGDIQTDRQGQPFKIGEFPEDGNVVLKTGGGKNHGPGFTSNLLETGETQFQSFTIKNHDSTSMAVTLEPEGLGKINIELKMNQDQIQGHIMVHEAAGKDLIESQLSNLLSDMTREGLQIGQFTVSLKQQGREQNPQGFSGSSEGSNPSNGTEDIGAITPISAGNNLIHIII